MVVVDKHLIRSLSRRHAFHFFAPVSGALFHRSAASQPAVAVTDVAQTRWQSCFLLAAAQAVAVKYPNYLPSIMYEDDTHVRLQCFDKNAHPVEICVTKQLLQLRGSRVMGGAHLASYNRALQAPVLWPAYLEKAFAAAGPHARGLSIFAGRGDPQHALIWLLGCPAKTMINVDHRALPRIAELFEQGECVVVHDAHHAYAVCGVHRSVSHNEENVDIELVDPRHYHLRSRFLRASQIRICAYSHTDGAKSRCHAPAPSDPH